MDLSRHSMPVHLWMCCIRAPSGECVSYQNGPKIWAHGVHWCSPWKQVKLPVHKVLQQCLIHICTCAFCWSSFSPLCETNPHATYCTGHTTHCWWAWAHHATAPCRQWWLSIQVTCCLPSVFSSCSSSHTFSLSSNTYASCTMQAEACCIACNLLLPYVHNMNAVCLIGLAMCMVIMIPGWASKGDWVQIVLLWHHWEIWNI